MPLKMSSMTINVIPLQDNHDVVFQAHLRHAQTRNLNNFASKTSTTLLPTFATTFATTQPLNAPQVVVTPKTGPLIVQPPNISFPNRKTSQNQKGTTLGLQLHVKTCSGALWFCRASAGSSPPSCRGALPELDCAFLRQYETLQCAPVYLTMLRNC